MILNSSSAYGLYENDSKSSLGYQLGIKPTEVIYAQDRFESLYDNSLILFESGNYLEAESEIKKYINLTFSYSCKGYSLYADILTSLEKKGDQIYSKLSESCLAMESGNIKTRDTFFDNMETGLKEADIWKYYFHNFLYAQQEEAGSGLGTPNYSFEYKDDISYLYAVLAEESLLNSTEKGLNYYKPIIEKDFYFKPFAIFLLYNLYEDSFENDDFKESLLLEILRYENQSYTFIPSFKNIHEIAYSRLADLTNKKDLDKSLYFRILSYLHHKHDQSNDSMAKEGLLDDRKNDLQNILIDKLHSSEGADKILFLPMLNDILGEKELLFVDKIIDLNLGDKFIIEKFIELNKLYAETTFSLEKKQKALSIYLGKTLTTDQDLESFCKQLKKEDSDLNSFFSYICTGFEDRKKEAEKLELNKPNKKSSIKNEYVTFNNIIILVLFLIILVFIFFVLRGSKE